MSDLLLALAISQDEDARRRLPRNRFSSTRIQSVNLNEAEFVREFRLNKSLTSKLIEELKPYLEPKVLRRNTLDTEIKVLCALNFFATGSYQRGVGNDLFINISQQSVSNCIRQVSEAIHTHILTKYITFPDDHRLQDAMKMEFYEYCRLGGVVGAVDCTHVAIIAPPDDGYHHERNYVNRKGFHSINVQLVCDMNMKILNIVARFPGCTHDAYIWRSCYLKQAFEHGNKINGDGWLLGDSGYKFGTYLHTPIDRENPTPDEELYNAAMIMRD